MAKLTRAEAVRRNDDAIRRAFVTSVAEQGWDSLTVSGVAKRAKVTVGAVYARAENIAELANDAWMASLSGVVRRALDTNCDAARSGDFREVLAASSAAENEIAPIRAALDLLIASQFDDEISEVIGADFSQMLSEVMVPADDSLQARHHAAALYLINSFLFGRLLALAGGAVIDPLTEAEAKILAGFYAAEPVESSPLELPEVVFRKTTTPDDATAVKVFETFSRWGYRRATVSRMARAAGTSPGGLLSTYSTKADLVAQSAHTSALSSMEVWMPYEALQAVHGAPQVRAHFLFEFLDPRHRQCWKSNLELARIATIYPELASFTTPAAPLQRTHLAVMLFALFVEGVNTLPFEGCFRVGYTT